MSAAHENTVDALLKRFEHMMCRYTPGTHDPDNLDVCRVLHTTDPSQVSSGIRSPGTQECDDIGLKIGVAHLLLSLFIMFFFNILHP